MISSASYASEHLQHNAYLARGRYIEQLERLEALVGRDRMHVIDSDDFSPTRVPPSTRCATSGAARWADIAFGKHNSRSRSPMSAELRTRLEDHFAPYDERLATWWGRVPSWRR
ncbi:hypothetical protein V2I01_12715 [Micromonospora sp. BRA006-A]|nr:hypothetical protein [Micromonospora sp. BRA006-A]